MKISVLSLEYSKDWSWYYVISELEKLLAPKYEFAHKYWSTFSNDGIDDKFVNMFDLVLAQNVSLFKYIKDGSKLIGRMGGMRTFQHVPGDAVTNEFDNDIRRTAVMLSTNEELAEIARRVHDRVLVIPDGVNLDLFRPIDSSGVRCDGNKFVVGFVGNICGGYAMYYKGWKYFVQATSRLRPQIEVFSLLYKYNKIPHEQMPDYFSKIDCLVSVSINEGCSNTIMEALACGVPVLLTEVGFHGERLTDGINCLFIERDIDDIIAKINMLRNSRGLGAMLSVQGRAFAEKYHDIKEVADEYDRVFKSVLELERK